ncbi:MAG: hypothetical protein A2X86_10920 [Bdellovibrionales bacterium GWA2_49_15]|nr:MAG: hypothetical protein A2X86_10920 [Bdellovibrionales bacterium GWA2_49_15]HAZ11488.1 transporter [Bdellovibrionales bacterium]
MNKLTLIIVLLTLGMMLFSGCAKMKGESAGEYLDDSVITTRVNAIIVKESEARYFKIDVTTTQGDVVLQGFVKNKDIEDSLVKKIEQIKGVKSVKSLLKVEEK